MVARSVRARVGVVRLAIRRRAMKYTVAADAVAKIEHEGKEGHAGATPRTVIEARRRRTRDAKTTIEGGDRLGSVGSINQSDVGRRGRLTRAIDAR